MTKFEEELNNKVPSDKEFQELLEQNAELTRENNVVNQINSKLEYQIANLKSQLQQQALPVVPEDVAKLPPFDDMKEYVLDERLLTIREYLNKLDDKSNSDITEAEAWCMIHEDIAYRAMLDGYQVEKPQLFYLVNKLTRQYLYRRDKVSFGEQDYCKDRDDKTLAYCLFTQQEIDSMQTGSYEQIEVTE